MTLDNCIITNNLNYLMTKKLILKNVPGSANIGVSYGYTLEEVYIENLLGSIYQLGIGNCPALKKITIPGGTYTYNIVLGDSCPKLEEIVLNSGVVFSGDALIIVSHSTTFTSEKIVSLFNSLPTKSSGTRTIYISSAQNNSLTSAQRLIATNKGWTITVQG